MIDPSKINLALFAEAIGKTSRIIVHEENAQENAQQHTLAVELIEAKALPAYATDDDPDYIRRDPFSLLFRGSQDTYLPQHMYTVEHPMH